MARKAEGRETSSQEPTPAEKQHLGDVEGAFFGRPGLVEDADVMSPGNFCNKLLQNCRVRPDLGERPHVAEVARGEALDLGEGVSQIARQLIDDLAAPTMLRIRCSYLGSRGT